MKSNIENKDIELELEKNEKINKLEFYKKLYDEEISNYKKEKDEEKKFLQKKIDEQKIRESEIEKHWKKYLEEYKKKEDYII